MVAGLPSGLLHKPSATVPGVEHKQPGVEESAKVGCLQA